MTKPSSGVDRLRRKAEPLLRRVLHTYWRVSRGMTMGVRALVVDDMDRVFLVRHGYVSGWHLPGGGVETGETCLSALTRELKEEGNVVLTGLPDFHGVFLNHHVSPRDHVVVYLVRRFQQESPPAPNREIVECGFFDISRLPPETTRGTRRRITEVFAQEPVSEHWQ